jgi:cyclic pyranopterin phosphate synthase
MSTNPKDLTHLDPKGNAQMVDVSGKKETQRVAVAEGAIQMAPETLAAMIQGQVKKGDVFQVARIAGIQAGKRAGELIPLCHLLPGVSIRLDVEAVPDLPGVRVRGEASIQGQTGVEMEALTAVSVALLTIYDMAKSLDRGMVIQTLRLVSKEGGHSGRWLRDGEP